MLIERSCLDQEDGSSDQSSQGPDTGTLHDGVHRIALDFFARLSILGCDVWNSSIKNDSIGAVDVGDSDERLVQVVVRTILKKLTLIFRVGVICFEVRIREPLDGTRNGLPSHPHSEYSSQRQTTGFSSSRPVVEFRNLHG